MAFNSQKVQEQAFSSLSEGSEVDLAADAIGKDREEAKEELVKEVSEVVETFLDNLSIISWFISNDWAAKLIAAIVRVFGKKFLSWLNDA